MEHIIWGVVQLYYIFANQLYICINHLKFDITSIEWVRLRWSGVTKTWVEEKEEDKEDEKYKNNNHIELKTSKCTKKVAWGLT